MATPRQSLTVVVDSREQRPFQFPSASRIGKQEILVETVCLGLKAGDYSIRGWEDQIAIERKSLSDLFGTTGKGRERFERELERLAKMEYAAIVIEGTWEDIARRPPSHTEMQPKSVIRSLLAWSQRYGVHIIAAGARPLAARLTYIMLERFWRDRVGP